MKCNRCGSDYSESYYKDKYSDEIICEECLLELDGITTEEETHYFLDGYYLGTDNNYSELIENICENTDYEEKTEIKRLYNKEPFKASEETTKVAIEGIEPVYIDTHGPIYRFLRRVKRLLKGWLIKLGIKKS